MINISSKNNEMLICKKSVKNNTTKIYEHFEVEHSINRTNEFLSGYLSSLINHPKDEKVKFCGICGSFNENKRALSKHMLLIHRNLIDNSVIDSLPIILRVDHLKTINKHIFKASIYKSEHFFDYNWNSVDIIDFFFG